MKQLRASALCLITLILIFSTVPMPMAANGAPIKVFLNFLPETSNYGPVNASGVALISIGESWMDLTANGLPQLVDEKYEAWLVAVDSDQMTSLGTFNADADSHIVYHIELGEQLPPLEYRYLVISVEPDPDPDTETADSRITLAGVLPNPELAIVSGTPTPPLEPGATASPGAPSTLPVTGNSLAPVWMGLFVAASLLLAGAALFRHARR